MRTGLIILLLLASFTTACDESNLPDALVQDTGFRDRSGETTELPDGSEDVAPPDGTIDATADAVTDTAVNPDDAADVPVRMTAYCRYNPSTVVQMAARISRCTLDLPQTLLNQFYSPESREEGTYGLRLCDILRETAAAAICGDISSAIKLIVNPLESGMTCSGMMPGCSGGSSSMATRCVSDHLIYDDCEGTGRICVATSTEVTCMQNVPTEMREHCEAPVSPRCVGTTLQRCIAGYWVESVFCANSESACDAANNGCTGAGAACTGNATDCDGSFIRRCRNGHYLRTDCNDIVAGSSCRTVGGSSFCGTATECDPVTAPAGGTCMGAMMQLCAGGSRVTFDCGTAGCTAGRGCNRPE